MEVVLGIDIGGTKTAYGYVDASGRCLGAGVIPTDSHLPAADFFRRLNERAAALLAGLGADLELAGIGIAAPNAEPRTGTITRPANLEWDSVNLVEEMGRYHRVPMAATNDANAVAIGEMLFGAARGMRDFIAVTLGTGVGSGIVANGELVHGADGLAGELGHLPVAGRTGRECGCGQLGCLETYASASGITRTAMELLALRRAPSALRAIPFDRLDSLALFELARQGDPLALEAFDLTGRILGAKLADMVLFSRPEAIILFGGVAAAGELIFAPARRAMEENLFPGFKGKVALLASGVAGADAAILGAGALIWNDLSRHR
jgi:glucokinase